MHKDIPGWEGKYRVLDTGAVEYIPMWGGDWRPVKTYLTNSGYRNARLLRKNTSTHRYVHRLVAQAFVENPNGLKEVNHLDGNKANNAASNLAWVSRRDNVRHAVVSGLMRSGERHHNSKLNWASVIEIRRLHCVEGMSQDRIALLFGVSPACVQCIVEYRTWRDDISCSFVDRR